MSELWERHADWWQENFTGGADIEYVEQILPLARQLLAGWSLVLDVGTGEGQVARALRSEGCRVIGIDPSASQLQAAVERGRDTPGRGTPGRGIYARAEAAALPLGAATVDAAIACLVFEHIEAMDDAVAEIARVLRPGGRFALFLNHPLLQTPGSGLIEDHVFDDRYWRVGPYLAEQTLEEEVQKGVFIPFVHRPLHRYVNALAEVGFRIREWHEPAPPGATGFEPSIPRLLVIVTELDSPS